MKNNQLQILSKSEDLQFLCGVYKLATFKQVTTATPAAEKIYSFIEREKEKQENQENQKKAALERKEQEKKEAEKKEKIQVTKKKKERKRERVLGNEKYD